MVKMSFYKRRAFLREKKRELHGRETDSPQQLSGVFLTRERQEKRERKRERGLTE